MHGYPIVYNCSDKSPIIIHPAANKRVDIALFAKVIDDRLQGTLLTCIWSLHFLYLLFLLKCPQHGLQT